MSNFEQMKVVLQDIEDYKTEIVELKAELKKTEDLARKDKLDNDIRQLRELILTLEKLHLALILAQGNELNCFFSR